MGEPKNDPGSKLIVLIAAGIIIFWGICWLATLYYIDDWNKRASFGDMFGSVNALFSGFALAGVIYAILLQRQELQLQRRELELTREELHRSAEAQEKSEEALREQIKQMQEQTELQLMPFVVLIKKKDDYLLWNAGNGTAINIKVLVLIEKSSEYYDVNDYTTKTSILTKGQEDFIDSTNISALEGHVFQIEFQNINKKTYFLSGKLINGRTELNSFDAEFLG